MSLSHETMLELMSYADDELDGQDRDRVERLVAANDEARRVVETLRAGQIAAWLTATADRHAAASGADGIADAVMRAAGPTAAVPYAAVASMARARARRSPGLQVAMTATVAALALAAGVALYVRGAEDHLDPRAPVASADPSVLVTQEPWAAAAQAAAGGVEVNEIDAPSRGVSVFEIPVAAAALAKSSGASSVVVWVDDDPGIK